MTKKGFLYIWYVAEFSNLGLIVLLLQAQASVCCSTRAFMVFETREKEVQLCKNVSREECNNFVHVLRYVGAMDNKTRLVGGAFFLALLTMECPLLCRFYK